MSEELEIEQPVYKKPKKKRKIFKRILISLLLLIFIGSTSLYFALKSEYVQKYTADKVVSILENALKAGVKLDKVVIKGFDEIEIYNLKLITEIDTLASIEKISLKYHISKLINNKVDIESINIYNPILKLKNRKSDSLWTYNLIAEASEDTTSSGLPDLSINIEKLNLINGKLIFYDSLSIEKITNKFDNKHFNLDEFNFSLNTDADLKNLNFELGINQFNFKENKSGLIVNQMNTNIALLNNEAYIKDFFIDINDNNIFLNAEVDNYSVLGDGNKNLDKAEIDFFILSKDFDNSLINKFIDGIILSKNEDLEIIINGTVKELNIGKFNIRSDAFEFNIAGNVNDLLDNPKIDLNIENTYFIKSKMLKMLKGMDLSFLPQFKKIDLKNINLKGGLDSIIAEIDIKSDFANLKGMASKIGNNHLLNIDFSNVKTEKLLKNKKLKSDINGNITLNTNIDSLFNVDGDIKLSLVNSRFQDNELTKMSLVASIKDKFIQLDELLIDLKDISDSYSNYNVLANGSIDLKSVNPKFKLDVNLNELELAKILNLPILPTTISSNIDIDMEGLELDSLNGSVMAKVNGIGFDKMYLEPFDFNVNIERENLVRDINIDTDFFNLNIAGDFPFDALISDIVTQSSYLVNHIKSNLFTIIKDSTVLTNELKDLTYEKYKCNINGYLKDISIVSNFTKGLSLNANSSIDLEVHSDSLHSTWDLKSLGLSSFELSKDNLKISIDSLDIKTLVEFDNIKKGRLDTDIDFYLRQIYINDLLINETKLSYIGRDKNAKVDINTNMMDLVDLEIKNIIDFSDDKISLIVDNFDVDFTNGYFLNSNKKFRASMTSNAISLKDLSFIGPKDEVIKFNGKFDYLDKKFKDCNLFLEKYNLTDLVSFLKSEQRDQLSSLKGHLEEFNLTINGSLDKPIINFKTFSDEIYFNNIKVGDIETDINYEDKNLTGKFLLDKGVNNSSLKVNAYKFPIDLSFADVKDRLKSKKDYKVIVNLNRFPFGVAEPFIPNLSNLEGHLNSKIKFEGNYKDGLQYTGSVRIPNAKLLLDNTNVPYSAVANIKINTDSIHVNYIKIKNNNTDLEDGEATVNGYIKLKDFYPDYIDLSINTNKIKLLRSQTKYAMPDIFGDFIISTGNNPLHFFGTLDKPNIEGDVNVLEADLKMPDVNNSIVIKSRYNYIIKGEKYEATIEMIGQPNSNNNDLNIIEHSQKDFMDLMNINVSVGFTGKFAMDIEIATGTDLKAEIGTKNRDRLVYKKNRDEKDPQLLGKVLIKENSKMTVFGKSIKTKGEVSFPTGNIANPYLDMEASYIGKTKSKIKFIVNIILKGFKENLTPIFEYTYDNNKGAGAPEEIQRNAISLLVFNSLKNKAAGGGLNLDDVSSYSESLISNLASQSLNAALSQYDINTELEFEDKIDFTKAKVTIKKQLGNGIEVSYGSSLSDLQNNVITFDVPASVFSDSKFLESLIIQVTKSNAENLVTKEQEIWGVKIKIW